VIILAFPPLILIGLATGWAEKANDCAPTSFNYQIMLLGLDWKPKRRETTKCSNRIKPGSLQTVFRCHISCAKSEYDLDFLPWGETLGCLLTFHNKKSSLNNHLLARNHS